MLTVATGLYAFLLLTGRLSQRGAAAVKRWIERRHGGDSGP